MVKGEGELTEGSMTKDGIGRTTMFGDDSKRRRDREKREKGRGRKRGRGESDEAERGAEAGKAEL